MPGACDVWRRCCYPSQAQEACLCDFWLQCYHGPETLGHEAGRDSTTTNAGTTLGQQEAVNEQRFCLLGNLAFLLPPPPHFILSNFFHYECTWCRIFKMLNTCLILQLFYFLFNLLFSVMSLFSSPFPLHYIAPVNIDKAMLVLSLDSYIQIMNT